MGNQIRLWGTPISIPKKGTIFIIHGMGEHSKRYERVANYLNKNGYQVAMMDHMGHGYNINRLEELGLIRDKFKSSVEELIYSIEKLRDDKPLFILGHSMGSFITQILLDRGIDNNGIILSGSGKLSNIVINLGYFISEFLLLFRNKRDTILNNLLFGRNNIKFLENKRFSWLTRDEKIVEEYEHDPLCGFIPYTSYFQGLFYLLKEASKVGNKVKYTKIPIYIFSGSDDPVGGYGRGTKKLYKFYKKIGYKDVTLKIYTKGRHEMLNEINRYEVYDELLEWLDRRVRG